MEGEKFMEWINLVAIIVIPILAVIIGQYLQDRSEKRLEATKIEKKTDDK